jgi:hypothetical protein
MRESGGKQSVVVGIVAVHRLLHGLQRNDGRYRGQPVAIRSSLFLMRFISIIITSQSQYLNCLKFHTFKRSKASHKCDF